MDDDQNLGRIHQAADEIPFTLQLHDLLLEQLSAGSDFAFQPLQLVGELDGSIREDIDFILGLSFGMTRYLRSQFREFSSRQPGEGLTQRSYSKRGFP